VRGLVDIAQRAEAAGMDGVVISDHVVMGSQLDRYPFGTFPFPPQEPWLEALTVLTAIATATDTLSLSTAVLIAPLRPAPLLAKIVATLDQLSAGRLQLGVGTGWQEEELTSHGVDPAQRGRVLTDTMRACRALWAPGPASFASETVTFEDIWCEPKPFRLGGPTVLFSGTLSPRNRRRIVELGDGWIPLMGMTPEDVSADIDELRRLFTDAGREPSALIVRPVQLRPETVDGKPSLESTLAAAAQLSDYGITDVTIGLFPYVSDVDAIPAFFEMLTSARAVVA
jgi:probable F420-dependent oxidoreductase